MAHIPPDRVNEVGLRDTRREPASDALSQADVWLRGIYEVSKALTAPARLEITLANVAHILPSFVQMRQGAIVLLDSEGEPQIAASAGNVDTARSGTHPIIPQAAIDEILATGTRLVIPDVSTSELFQDDVETFPSGNSVPITYIGVPVKAEHKILGVLSIDRVRDCPTGSPTIRP